MLRLIAYVTVSMWGAMALVAAARAMYLLGARIRRELAVARARLELDDRRLARTLDAWTLDEPHV